MEIVNEIQDIVNINRNGYNSLYCIEDCIATIAYYEGIDFYMMFMDSYKFGFDNDIVKKTRIVNSGLMNNIERTQFENLSKFHGMTFSMGRTMDAKVALEEMKKELLSGRLIIVKVDSFYCKWDVGYEKLHQKHMFICTGIRDKGDICVCDPFYGKIGLEMSEDDFCNAYMGLYMKYNIEEKEYDYREEICNTFFNDNYVSKLVQELRQLGDAYLEYYDMVREYRDYEDARRVQEILLKIIMDKNKYYYLLSKVFDVKSKKISDDMEIVIGMWVVIKNLLFKAFFSKKVDVILNSVKDKLYRIAELEEEIYCLIRNDVKMDENLCESELMEKSTEGYMLESIFE